ncbi:MAG: MFS transporter, partial [Microbacterium sp.]|nr:MFS transporter [Microbacterium sp.]
MPDYSSRRWVGLVFISIAVSLIIVDSTIVNVAVPSIVDDLGISSTQVQWVQEAYTLVFAALLLVFGSLADRFGRRRMMLTGVAIFAVSSVAAALAPTGDLLILARLVQGVGGAMILPTTLSLINATFRGKERGLAFAVWGSTIGGMAAVGPLLGGWLTTDFSWRWAFGINVPLGIAIIVGVALTVAESREPERRGIDVVGAILSVVTTGSLVFGLVEGRTLGWWRTATPLRIGDWTWP